MSAHLITISLILNYSVTRSIIVHAHCIIGKLLPGGLNLYRSDKYIHNLSHILHAATLGESLLYFYYDLLLTGKLGIFYTCLVMCILRSTNKILSYGFSGAFILSKVK